ncbi:hypothetical protein [Curtobacterium sp. L1-20]|uniref:hypothetical protein n=1 Tax=Curtobacterium sp. L1-20 TaxID=3138181 RepID=UPI003B52BC36
MGVALEGSELFHMAGSTFMWVQTTHFAVTGADGASDEDLLGELLAADGYGHDYASPFPGGNTEGPVAVHGPWRLDSIGPTSFTPTTAADAATVLRTWSTDQAWTDPDFRQPADVVERLEALIRWLGTGTLHHLRNPGPEAEHDYGWVTGGNGFHEFVRIDRTARRISVVVASDD